MRSTPGIEDALDRAIAAGDVGLQVAAYVGEELVVNTWRGSADADGGRTVDGTTLFPVMSITNAFTATAVNIQADAGRVDLDRPVAEYWPEFGANGGNKASPCATC